MSKVWLVTGSARGLGRDIAEAALAAGNRLIATARAASWRGVSESTDFAATGPIPAFPNS